MVLTVESLTDVVLSIMVWWAVGYGLGLVSRVIRQVMEKI